MLIFTNIFFKEFVILVILVVKVIFGKSNGITLNYGTSFYKLLNWKKYKCAMDNEYQIINCHIYISKH
jgi:hypothetical protein